MNTDKYLLKFFTIRVHPCKSVATFSYSLEIVVKHSGMTNQTHLLWQLHRARPNQGPTPRANNIVCSINMFTHVRLPD